MVKARVPTPASRFLHVHRVSNALCPRSSCYWTRGEDEPHTSRKRDGKGLSPEPSPVLISHQDLVDRQTFNLRLAKAPMYFGAPSHRIESQLTSVSRTLRSMLNSFTCSPSLFAHSEIKKRKNQRLISSKQAVASCLADSITSTMCTVVSFVVTWMPRRGYASQPPSQIASALQHPNAMLLYFLVLLFHLPHGIQRLSIRRNHIRARRSTSLFPAAGCGP